MIGNRKFTRGEGVLLLQGSELNFIKVPAINNIKKLQRVCIEALNKDLGNEKGDGAAVDLKVTP